MSDDVKNWGDEEFWGIGYEYDPQFFLTESQENIQRELIDRTVPYDPAGERRRIRSQFHLSPKEFRGTGLQGPSGPLRSEGTWRNG